MKTLITLLTAIALMFSGLTGSSASTLPPCEFEDSINCYWDAETMGNGHGSSFENIDGQITYTTPVEAHTCAVGATLTADRQCTFTPQTQELVSVPTVESVQPVQDTTQATAWQLWDAVGASSLLPDSATTVTFLSHNTTGYPLTADTIIVWDNYGNFYQFHIG